MGEELESIPARCAGVRERLSDWVDGELEAGDAGAVEAHLRTCSPCRRFACEMEATVLALRALGLPCCRG